MKGYLIAEDDQKEKIILLSQVEKLEELAPRLFRTAEILKTLSALSDDHIMKHLNLSADEIEEYASNIDDIVSSIYNRENIDRVSAQLRKTV